jgi:hypothetical protein
MPIEANQGKRGCKVDIAIRGTELARVLCEAAVVIGRDQAF